MDDQFVDEEKEGAIMLVEVDGSPLVLLVQPMDKMKKKFKDLDSNHPSFTSLLVIPTNPCDSYSR